MGQPASHSEKASRAFVGRESEMQRLLSSLDQARNKAPGMVLVRGEAGVGKSRLLREFAERSRAEGARVLWGSCVSLGSGDIPYAALVDALRRLVKSMDADEVKKLPKPAYSYLASLLPGMIDDSPAPEATIGAGDRLRLFANLLLLFDRLGREAPVVLVIEDLHWADQSTVDFLSYLARARSDERLLVVGSLRTGDLPARHPVRVMVAELGRARAIDLLDLARFSRQDVREYLRAALDIEVTHDLVERALELTEGNALFLEEVVVAGTLTAGDDAPAPLPATVEDLLLPRYEMLSEDARTVMGVATVIGRRASHQLLAAVCELPEDRLLAALRECVANQMLTVSKDGNVYRIYHALLREVVYRRLIPGDRLRLHRMIAQALTSDSDLGYVEESTVAAELSYHWFEARAFPEALAAAVTAGNHAMQVMAVREASRQFDRALRVWRNVANAAEVAGLPSYRLRMLAADAARWSGQLPRAVELIRSAIAEVDPAGEPAVAGELYERLGSYLWESGEHGAADEAYARAARLLEGAPDSPVAARVLAVSATERLRNGYPLEGLALGQAALDMARRVEARDAEGRALNSVGVALGQLGRVDEGVAALEEALRIAGDARLYEDLCRAYGNLVLVLNQAGRSARGFAVGVDGLARIREAGLEHTRGRSVLANNTSESLLQLGRWDEATRILDQLLRDHPESVQLFPRLTLAVIKVGQGDFTAAERLLTHVQEAGAAVQQPWFVGGLYACLAEMAIWRQEPESARQAVLTGLHAVAGRERRVELLQLCALGLRNEADEALRLAALPGTARADAHTGQSARDDLVAWLDRLAEGTEDSYDREVAAPLIGLCRAEHARAAQTDKPDVWAAVAERWQALERPYPRAYALFRFAEAAVRMARGRRRAGGEPSARALRSRAQTAAAEAHGITVELGAVPLRSAIEAFAHDARLELTDPVQPATQPSGKVSLTPREQDVLALVVAGRTNKQIANQLFITEKTASVHVSNLLRKLNVERRGQIGAAARDHGLSIP